MKKYELVYEQPYEYDDDSPSGIGDHDVGYTRQQTSFEARGNRDASRVVLEYLEQGGLQFDFHYGSPSPGLYPRRFVSLREVFDSREVVLSVQKGRKVCGGVRDVGDD